MTLHLVRLLYLTRVTSSDSEVEITSFFFVKSRFKPIGKTDKYNYYQQYTTQ